MVQFANAATDPKAMMVEFPDAALALTTVSGAIGHSQVANITEPLFRQLVSLWSIACDFKTLVGLLNVHFS